MKKLSYSLILIILIVLFSPVVNLHASVVNPNEPCTYDSDLSGTPNNQPCKTSTPYVLLTPLPCKEGTTGCIEDPKNPGNFVMTSFDPATTDSEGKNTALGAYLNMMIRLFIGICAVLATIMIVVGGIEYMTTELISSKEAGRQRITNAIFGLLLALGAWTLLNTINPNILKTDLEIKEVTVVVDQYDNVAQSYDPTTKKYKNGYTYGQHWAGTVATLPAGVTTNHSGADCATVGQGNCTSLKGLKLDYINVIQAKCPNKCGTLTITGGTEFWLHGGASSQTSHGPGSPTVDLSKNNEALNNYIKSGTLISSNRWTKDGVSYFNEGDHWHVYKQ